jgi:hypothetical protein
MVNSRRSNREPSMTEVGQKHALPRRNIAARFTSINGHCDAERLFNLQ